MLKRRATLARKVVVAGLVSLLLLTVLQIQLATPLPVWLGELRRGQGDAVAGALSLLVVLFLIVPAARGRPWALVLATLVLFLLSLGVAAYLVQGFAHPEQFGMWVLDVSYVLLGLVAAGFGVVVCREALRRIAPMDGRPPARGLGRGGAVLLAAAAVWVGMVAVAAAVARKPPAAGIPGHPEAAVVLATGLMSFSPAELAVPAGKETAVLLVNRSSETHSFDVDPLGVHVRIPARGTAVALLRVPGPADIPFYCGVPGHAAAGMVGTIHAR